MLIGATKLDKPNSSSRSGASPASEWTSCCPGDDPRDVDSILRVELDRRVELRLFEGFVVRIVQRRDVPVDDHPKAQPKEVGPDQRRAEGEVLQRAPGKAQGVHHHRDVRGDVGVALWAARGEALVAHRVRCHQPDREGPVLQPEVRRQHEVGDRQKRLVRRGASEGLLVERVDSESLKAQVQERVRGGEEERRSPLQSQLCRVEVDRRQVVSLRYEGAAASDRSRAVVRQSEPAGQRRRKSGEYDYRPDQRRGQSLHARLHRCPILKGPERGRTSLQGVGQKIKALSGEK